MLDDPRHEGVAGLAGQRLAVPAASEGGGHVLEPLVVCDQRRVAVDEGDASARAHLGARGGQGLEGPGVHARERRGTDHEAGDAQRGRPVGDVGQVQARAGRRNAGRDVPRTHTDDEAVGLILGQARQDLGLPARGHLLRRLGGNGEGQERGGQIEGRVSVDATDPAEASGVADAGDELVSDEADPHGVPFLCLPRAPK